MRSLTQFEDRASRSRSKHEGESSSSLCDRLSRTRDTSQRQLPTDQDYAVSTREYQTDQSSLKPAPTAAGPVLEQRQKQQQNKPHRCAEVDGSLHIRESLNKVFRGTCIPPGAKQAAEKLLNSHKVRQKQTAGAKAPDIFQPLTARLKSCPVTKHEFSSRIRSFSAACKAHAHFVRFAARLKPCPFKTSTCQNFDLHNFDLSKLRIVKNSNCSVAP
jgi:hypothetical protein